MNTNSKRVKIQRVVTKNSYYGEYYNFLYSPGSIDSLVRFIEDGWTLYYINDNKEAEQLVAVFEKEVDESEVC